MALRLSQPFLRKYIGGSEKIVMGGSSGIGGNIGAGRHYDPTKHMTLEDMKRKSMFYQDVYLDGYVCNYFSSQSSVDMDVLSSPRSLEKTWTPGSLGKLTEIDSTQNPTRTENPTKISEFSSDILVLKIMPLLIEIECKFCQMKWQKN